MQGLFGPPPPNANFNANQQDNTLGEDQQDPMMRMMQQMLSQGMGGQQQQPGGAPGQEAPGGADDPMMQMLQQLMGGAGGPGGGFGGMGQAQQQAPPTSNSAYMWRIVHALFALTLALYVTFTARFTGSKLARSRDALAPGSEEAQHFTQRLFFLFATAEVLLQSTRYYMEKGEIKGGGWLRTVAAFLPPPWNGYVKVVGRYAVIWQTVVSDAMVVVFVLGVTAWLKGAVA